MYNTIAHYLLSAAQPTPQKQLVTIGHFPTVYILSVSFYGMEHPFGQSVSAILVMLSHPLSSFLCSCSLVQHGKINSS